MEEAIAYISTSLDNCRSFLDKEESIASIEHFLNHDEYEIAFEILFLDIMACGEIPRIDFAKGVEIAKSLKLDKLTIYDVNFWSKFIAFMQRNVG